MPLRQLFPDAVDQAANALSKVDIFAIHGLNPRSKNDEDHAWDTWRTPSGAEGRLWLRDDLPQYTPHARIFLYEYNATAVYGKDRDTFHGKADELLEAIRIKRGDDEARPILFFGHSMGGLLIKQALINAHINPKYTSIKDATTGLAFFATPHHGGDWKLVSLGGMAAKIATKAGFQKGDDVLETLKRGSLFHDIMQEQWRQQLLQYDIISFWGSEDEVVPRESARLGLPGDRENIVKLNAGHAGVCKFGPGQKDQDNFELVRSNIKDIYKNAIKDSLDLDLTNEERKFIELLPGHDIGRFLDFYNQFHANSCDWLLETPEFRGFLSSARGRVLHLVGEPGSGKSTAAAWMYQTSRSWTPPHQPLLFSFHGKPSASAAWSSLLYQLLHLDGTSTAAFHVALEDEDQSSGWKSEQQSSDRWTVTRLRRVFRFVVGRVPPHFAALFIIDALDECDENPLPFLQSIADTLQDRPASRTKFLFLSRRTSSSRMDSLFAAAGGVSRIIMNDNTSHLENVERYIQAELENLCKARPGMSEMRSEMVEELQKRSVGIYLLASLNFKSLVTIDATKANIRSIIRVLPGDLQTIYERALGKVPRAHQRKVSALLLWVTFAFRPLHAWELSAAIALTCLDRDVTDLDGLQEVMDLDILGGPGIRPLVGPLIRVTGENMVSLVHSSARQFLLDLNSNSLNWVCKWWTDRKARRFNSVAAMASHTLSMKCQKLSVIVDSATITALLGGTGTVNNAHTGLRSLVRYAIESLPEHVRQSPPGQQTHAAFASFLTSDSGQAWVEHFWVLRDPSQPYRSFSPLELGCALSLVDTVKELLPSVEYPKVEVSNVRAVQNASKDATALLTAADLASMYGNVEILQVLCGSMGTPVYSDGLIPQTTFKAVRPGTEGEVVEAARKTAMQQLSWYRPLHVATAYGHAEAAEYLIARGASLLREDQNGKWPIEIAMESKIEGLVTLLLRRHWSERYGPVSLVQRFVDVANSENITMLLKVHPEILPNGLCFRTIHGTHHGSMLHVAAARGSVLVYKQLIKLGVESGLRDSDGRQAVHYAAASGQAAFVRSLLMGCTSSKLDEDTLGRQPLFYATLGASCISNSWTTVSDRKEVMSILFGNVDSILSNSLVDSALRSLAAFSPDKWHRQERGSEIDVCIRHIHSLGPEMRLNGGFLHAAFGSNAFPLEAAMEFVANINETDSKGRTALHIAAAGKERWNSCHMKLVAMLDDIDHRDVEGLTALRLAVDSAQEPELRYEDVLWKVRILLGQGADVTFADDHAITPIVAAATFLAAAPPRPHTDGLLSLLVSRDITATEAIEDELIPRLVAALAAAERFKDLASLIKTMSPRQRKHWLDQTLGTVPISAEVVFICRELGWSAEEIRAMSVHLDQIPWLEHPGCGRRLVDAAEKGDKDMIDFFLDIMNGDVNLKDERSRTMLSHGAKNGQVELTKHLLSRGADPSIPDREGWTAVCWAAGEGKLDILKLLIKAGAPINAMDVATAAQRGRVAVRAYLMKEQLKSRFAFHY